MRAPLALALALMAVGGLLSSCGKGQRSASVRTVTVQASGQTSKESSGGSAQGGSAKAQARAFAQAVNLRTGDVPGYKAAPREDEGSSSKEKLHEKELQRCVGSGEDSHPLVEASSPSFERKASIAQVSVSSSVTVHSSAALAKKELEAIRSPHTRSCFTKFFKGLFSGAYKGATIGPVSLESGTPPAAGTSGSFGWRLRTSLTVRSVRLPFDLDILGFFYGRSSVALMSFGVAVEFPAQAEQQLFLLLLSRAKAHRP